MNLPARVTRAERPLSAQPLEDHRGLDAIAPYEAFTAGGRRRDGVKPVAERGLGVDRLFELGKVPDPVPKSFSFSTT